MTSLSRRERRAGAGAGVARQWEGANCKALCFTPPPNSVQGLTCTLCAKFRPKPCHYSSSAALLSVRSIVFITFSVFIKPTPSF